MKSTLALILAGGRVNELSVLTLLRPKASVPFGGGYRVIDFPLSNLLHSDIDRIGILSQYRSNSLMHHIGSGAGWDMLGSSRGITMLPPMIGTLSSDWYKGTADAVYQNRDFINDIKPDYVLILSGDHIYRMDYQKLIRFHRECEADLTISFVRVPDDGMARFGQGVIGEETEDGGILESYVEKPDTAVSNWASMTIYLFTRNALDDVLTSIDHNKNIAHFGRDVFPALVKRKRVFGYKFKGPWAYTRTIDEYWHANMELLKENPSIDVREWNVRTNLDNERVRDRAPSIFGPSSEVQNSLVHRGCTIDGIVKNSILYPGISVAKNAVVENSILFYDTTVGANAQLNRVICDVNVNIGADALIGHGSVDRVIRDTSDILSSGISLIGRNVQIPCRYTVGRNCIIYPFKNENQLTKNRLESGRIIK
jgi:glucose-1-phosphate adenylyltransferase